LLFGDRATAQYADAVFAHGDDGRFNSMLRWPRVDDQRNSSLEFIEHVLRSCGTEATKSIRAWRSQRPIQFTHNFGENWMRANSDCDCIKTCCDNFRNNFAFLQDHCERAWPKLVG